MSEKHYHMSFPRPQLPDNASNVPFIHGLDGFLGAGNAVYIVTKHLLSSLESELVAEFAIDGLIDYLGRRPTMLMHDGQLDAYRNHHLKLWLLYDNAGTPFFLLEGNEPNLFWETLADNIVEILKGYGVTRSGSLSSAGLSVPHTRTLPILHHGSKTIEAEGITQWEGNIRFPASFDLYLDYHLQKAGFEVNGLTSQVPSYLAQSHYSTGAVQLLEALSTIFGLDFPMVALSKDAKDLASEIETQMEENLELVTVIRSLEENYDSFKAEHERQKFEEKQMEELANTMLDEDALGEELEKFLSQVDSSHPPRDEGDS
ncbi:MAG: PAC2 family protein [Lawsonella sp.]